MNLILLVTVFVSVLNQVQAEDKACKSAVGDLTKKQLKGVTECTAQMKFKNAKERQAKMTCVMKCVLTRENVLTPDGYADPIGSLVFITANLPDNVQEWARTVRNSTYNNEILKIRNKTMSAKVMMGCFEMTAAIKPDEENCKSYDPLIKCSLSALNMFCQPPK